MLINLLHWRLIERSTINMIHEEFIENDIEIDEPSLYQIYSKTALKHSILSREEEKELGKRIEQGDERAKEELINHNLKLVVNIAKKNNGLDIMDMISEGNIGLIDAADRFDYTKNYKFSVFAIWHINQKIKSAINRKSSMIRIPADEHYKALAIKKAKERYMKNNGCEPCIDDLIQFINEDYPESKKMSPREITDIYNTFGNYISLNDKVNSSDEDFELLSLVEDPHSTVDSAFREMETKQIRKNLLRQLGGLKERDRDAILMRYGFWQDEFESKYHIKEEKFYSYITKGKMNLWDVGNIIGVTGEWIRRLENDSFRLLRKRMKYDPFFQPYVPNSLKNNYPIGKYRMGMEPVSADLL